MSKVVIISSLICSAASNQILASSQSYSTFNPVHIVQLVSNESNQRQYSRSLSTLLMEINTRTTIEASDEPIEILSLTDKALQNHSMLYINVDSFTDWSPTPEDQAALKQFIELGGFVYLDAGIKSEFLRANKSGIHSFADWEVRPLIEELFLDMFPDNAFEPLPRNHPIFSIVYSGLPDGKELPSAIRDFVLNEKWPGGTYSLVGLTLKDRLAVVASPVIAMGWGRNETGDWLYQIDFRVREGSKELSQRLSLAGYSGDKFEANRADGLVDIIFTQKNERPGWVQEPDGEWRAFRYYSGKEISDFAHIFYTRLGINIFVYGLLN